MSNYWRIEHELENVNQPADYDLGDNATQLTSMIEIHDSCFETGSAYNVFTRLVTHGVLPEYLIGWAEDAYFRFESETEAELILFKGKYPKSIRHIFFFNRVQSYSEQNSDTLTALVNDI